MAHQMMVQQQGGGQSMQQQGGGQTAQLAGSKTARHEPAAGAADEAPKPPNRRGKKKQKIKLHSTSVTTLRQIRALRMHAVLDGYQSATGSIFQRTASAEPDLPSADCDPVPSLVESSDSGGVCFLSCLWSLLSFLDSFYTNRVTLLHIATVDILSSPLIWSS